MTEKYNRLVIDGNNFLFRVFYSKRPEKLYNGFNVANVSHFMHMLRNLQKRFHADEIFITWDKRLNPTKENFRKQLVSYKAQRVESENIKKIFETIDHVQKFVDALGIKTIYPVNLEADDVIRYMTMGVSGKTLVVSSDKDLLQLVQDSVHLLMPVKDVLVNPENFKRITNIEREDFILHKCIVGDVSDNVPGLDKFGPIRASALISKILKTENGFDYQQSGLSEDQIDIIERNIKIMDLSKAEILCPDEYEFYKKQDEESTVEYDGVKLKALFKEYGFFSFSREIGEWNKNFNKNSLDIDLLSCITM